MWFDPPQEIPTRLLARLPDNLRRLQRSEWADANRAGNPAFMILACALAKS